MRNPFAARSARRQPPDPLAGLLDSLTSGDAGDAQQAAASIVADPERVLAAPVTREHHVRLHDAGRAALSAQALDAAEVLAIAALRALPRYGAALKLLGLVLLAQGRPDEAAVCHRYGLPQRVRDRWFGATEHERIDSRRANSRGALIRRVAWPASSTPLAPPRQLVPRPVKELSATTLNTAEASTTSVPRGRLWFDTFNAVVWDRDGRQVSDLCRGHADVVHAGLGEREPLHVPGRVALLGNRNQNNYYHWMNDVLPRLAVLQGCEHRLDGIDRFMLAPLREPFQHESLARLGIGAERLLFTSESTYIQADELLMPMFGSNTLGLGQGAWNPEFLKQTFLADAAPSRTDRRLYVSRGSEGARGVINDAELLARLGALGFERVQAESLDVAGQAKLFAEAEVVLGPHGAGFSNIAFCRPGTHVIELFSAHMAPCFWSISELTGLQHAVHFCGEADERTRPSDAERYHRTADDRRRAPFHVDIESVLALLAMLDIDAR